MPEFFVWIDHSDWCGAGANCDYWIFQKQAHGYVLLLNDKMLVMKATMSHGYHDLASATPMGFCSWSVQRLDVTPYKFDGKRYCAQPGRTDCQPFKPPVQ